MYASRKKQIRNTEQFKLGDTADTAVAKLDK
jgi:hypothetical protein